ncbi:TonB-dependent siderophore receptor [Limnobacter sp. 130]|uniref:TonB-dependent siderophore receptor n=1 Tax=Limnobacter sp. 130 TaxID=2653147 RepID=UPI0012F1A963|nr:TonB-dependent siderophore receptor [Limnobacter sp. 130]VWX32782.1 TonB-dependent siderophore receptor [Limnobacter sp. 130]
MKLKPIALALLSLGLPATALAQNNTELQEVEVQAREQGSYSSSAVQVGTFRDTAPIDVPLTVNSVTREVLDAQSATTLFGALRNTAGVTRSQLNGSTYDNIAIRGILVENRGNYRLNGSLPIINLVDVPLENKQQVEVLKGASSLYYGFIPPSGVVNLVTKRAGNKPVFSLSQSVNEHGAAMTHIDWGRKFGENDNQGLRVNLVKGSEDIGVNKYSGERELASIAYDWKITDRLSFRFDVEHYEKSVSEQASIRLLPAVNGSVTLPPVPDNKTNLAGEWQQYDANAQNYLARVDYVLSDSWGVLFEAGYAETTRDRAFSRFQNYDLNTGEGELQIFYSRNQQFDNTNYRGEIYGELATGPITHNLSFGYTTNSRASNTPGVTAPQSIFSQNLYNPRDIAPQNVSFTGAYSAVTIDDQGLYVFDRMQLNEQWQVLAGLRRGDYRTEDLRVAADGTRTVRLYNAQETTPSLAVMYKPRQDVSVYASYVEGLEESGQAPASSANAFQLLDPAKSEQREVGAKLKIGQNSLAQIAYFDIDRASTFEDPNTMVFGLNGKANYSGFEMAWTGELNKQLSIAASALLMDAELQNDGNPATVGKVPENTAEKTASLFAEYRLISVPGLSFNGGLYYTGERAVNDQNQAFIGGYTVASLGVRYATVIGSTPTQFQLVVDNPTDKNYYSTAGNGLIGVGTPRTIKAIVSVDL